MARPDYPPPLISLPEARAIIGGAIAYAHDANLVMAVVVVDHAGNVVSADRWMRLVVGAMAWTRPSATLPDRASVAPLQLRLVGV